MRLGGRGGFPGGPDRSGLGVRIRPEVEADASNHRLLLPRERRPNAIMQLGLIGCGVFFFAITAMVLLGR